MKASSSNSDQVRLAASLRRLHRKCDEWHEILSSLIHLIEDELDELPELIVQAEARDAEREPGEP